MSDRRVGSALVCLVCLCLGCGDALLTYPLKAQAYDQDADCLAPEEVIDVIEGEPGPTCEGVLCLQSEETGTYFITPNCEAPPFYVDHTDDETGVCVAALAAWERGEDGACP